MKTCIRKIGNSLGVIIGKKLLKEAGIESNMPVNIQVKEGTIVIKAVRKRKPIDREISTWRKQFKESFIAGEKSENSLIADNGSEWDD